MRHLIVIVFITAVMSAVSADTLSPDSTDNAYVRFIGGMLMLRTTPFMADQELRITRYRQLLKVTGVTAREATRYLSTLRNDPDAGNVLYDAIQKEISLEPDTTQ